MLVPLPIDSTAYIRHSGTQLESKHYSLSQHKCSGLLLTVNSLLQILLQFLYRLGDSTVMPSSAGTVTPGLTTFSRSVRNRSIPVESSTQNLISLLKRRQIRDSKPCAMATAYLLRRVVETFKFTDVTALIERVQQVGQRLSAAQPREMAIGNIVRRILGVIREEAEEDREGETNGYSVPGAHSRQESAGETGSRAPNAPGTMSRALSSSPLRQSASTQSSPEPPEGGEVRRSSPVTTSSGPGATSMFSLLSHPRSTAALPAPMLGSYSDKNHLPLVSTGTAAKAEIVEGIQEILEEVEQADDQIAGYSLEHIHSNEIILTHKASTTVQKFLLKAAVKRRFTVVHAEGFPNGHEFTHATVIGKAKEDTDDESRTGSFQKSLTTAGITVILIPDSAVYALMSRINKIILDTHVIFANGGLVAASGAKVIAQAANMHRTPVVVLSGIYKLSPVYPFDIDLLMENGDPGGVIDYGEGDLVNNVEFENPLFEYIPPELVNLYVTNLGGHAPTYLYRIVADHYRLEDTNLDTTDPYQWNDLLL